MVRQKKVIVSRSPDEIREDILRFFYDTHKSASSPKQIRLKITDVKRGLKAMGISGKEAMTNIDYLIEGGWIKKEVETKQIPTPKGGVYPAATSYYKASNKTIDHFGGPSKFQKVEQGVAGINITNVQGITTLSVGDSNDIAVNADFVGLYGQLEALSNSIKKSGVLSDEQKLNYVAEIDTIKAQLAKPKPDKSIIQKAWDALSALATVAGIADFFAKVSPLIGAIK